MPQYFPRGCVIAKCEGMSSECKYRVVVFREAVRQSSSQGAVNEAVKQSTVQSSSQRGSQVVSRYHIKVKVEIYILSLFLQDMADTWQDQ